MNSGNKTVFRIFEICQKRIFVLIFKRKFADVSFRNFYPENALLNKTKTLRRSNNCKTKHDNARTERRISCWKNCPNDGATLRLFAIENTQNTPFQRQAHGCFVVARQLFECKSASFQKIQLRAQTFIAPHLLFGRKPLGQVRHVAAAIGTHKTVLKRTVGAHFFATLCANAVVVNVDIFVATKTFHNVSSLQ